MTRIAISRLCADLRPAVLKALSATGGDIIAIEIDSRRAKQLLEQILPLDYVVAESMENPEELAVLKKGDIEQLDLYLCGYCGMIFGNDLERNLHQRVHYFGFG